mmetsp:Transcript_24726/g.44716  ORF Transcript_24726/g.44716 Transcript_24726/m.44716 type:complete len:93 (-) Transcript_24726:739-1017(-)
MAYTARGVPSVVLEERPEPYSSAQPMADRQKGEAQAACSFLRSQSYKNHPSYALREQEMIFIRNKFITESRTFHLAYQSKRQASSVVELHEI